MTETSRTPPAKAAPLSARDRGVVFTMLVATFVVILNETIMNVALPRLMTELSVGASTVQWLSTAFLLTMAVTIPATGFLIQRFGTRTLFIGALGLFSLGTFAASVAPGFALLLAGRVVQALGTALMLPLLTTTILALVPAERRGAFFGTVSIVISVAPAVGPTVSGLILEVLPWRYLFLFVLPIALAVLGYGAARLENVGERRGSSLDLPSVALSAMGFGGVVYGFSRAGEGGWGSPAVLGALLLGGASLVLFTLRQLGLQRRDAPLLDLRAFSYPMFSLSVVLVMVVMMALFASAILLPIYLQGVRGLSSLATGLVLLPGGALMGLAAPTVGRLFDRYGPVALTSSGAALLTGSLLGFTTLGAATPVWLLLVQHVVFSLGLALLFTPVLATGLNPLPSRLYSHGSAIMSTLQQVAGAVGTALLITVMTGRTALEAAAGAGSVLAQTAGLHAAFMVAALLAALSLGLTFFLRRTLPAEAEGAPGGEGQPAFSAH